MEVKDTVILSKISKFKALNLELIFESIREARLERMVADGAELLTPNPDPSPFVRGKGATSPEELVSSFCSKVIILGLSDGKKPGFLGVSKPGFEESDGFVEPGEKKKSKATFLASPNHKKAKSPREKT